MESMRNDLTKRMDIIVEPETYQDGVLREIRCIIMESMRNDIIKRMVLVIEPDTYQIKAF